MSSKVRTGSPTGAVPGVERSKPDLRQTAHPLSAHAHRSGFCGLHLTEGCRSHMLCMSAATADRLLRSQRTLGQRGFSMMRAGTLLKQQIPIRTFQEWNETQPGLTSSGPGGPLWHRHRGRLRLHADAHRCGNRVDGMSCPPAPESGNGSGTLPTRARSLRSPSRGWIRIMAGSSSMRN
jgi:hypothetical protein